MVRCGPGTLEGLARKRSRGVGEGMVQHFRAKALAVPGHGIFFVMLVFFVLSFSWGATTDE